VCVDQQKVCDPPDAAPFQDDERTRYAVALCDAIASCGGNAAAFLSVPTDAEIVKCIIPTLQKISGKALVGSPSAVDSCEMGLRVAPSASVPCSGLSIDNPPPICAGLFQ
jgi:hypothetical protein